MANESLMSVDCLCVCVFVIGKVKANTAYHGVPAPPNGQPFISFEENDLFQLVSDDDSSWWQVRTS